MKSSAMIAWPAFANKRTRNQWSKRLVQLMWIGAAGIAFPVLVGWLGLQVNPAPFPAVPGQPAPLETVPLPTGLPAPVERFYRQTYGENTRDQDGRHQRAGLDAPAGPLGVKIPNTVPLHSHGGARLPPLHRSDPLWPARDAGQ